MNALTKTEAKSLAAHERTIAKGLDTFRDVGAALAEIRKRKLYRQGFETFDDYCRERWEFTASRARQLISAAQVADECVTNGNTPPGNERQARAIRSEQNAPEPEPTPTVEPEAEYAGVGDTEPPDWNPEGEVDSEFDGQHPLDTPEPPEWFDPSQTNRPQDEPRDSDALAADIRDVCTDWLNETPTHCEAHVAARLYALAVEYGWGD